MRDSDIFVKPGPRALNYRRERQGTVFAWCIAAFGYDEATSVEQRGIRFFEEAAETAQSCNVSREKAHFIIDYVYDRPVGNPEQEVGGVGLTLLALCEALFVDADEAEKKEIRRVLDKPLEHFAKRNLEKKQAGLIASVLVGLPSAEDLDAVASEDAAREATL